MALLHFLRRHFRGDEEPVDVSHLREKGPKAWPRNKKVMALLCEFGLFLWLKINTGRCSDHLLPVEVLLG